MRRRRPSAGRLGAALAVALALASAGCSQGDSVFQGDEGTSTSAPSSGAPTVAVPEGWSVSTDGMVTALSAADLDPADPPAGPRARLVIEPPATADTGEPADLESAIAALASPEAPFAALLEQPQTLSVDGLPVVAVTLSDTVGAALLNQRYLIGSLPDGTTVIWVLEAPAEQWAAVVEVLATVPAIG